MQLLQDARVVFVDSTFRVVPALFYLLFTIFVIADFEDAPAAAFRVVFGEQL